MKRFARFVRLAWSITAGWVRGAQRLDHATEVTSVAPAEQDQDALAPELQEVADYWYTGVTESMNLFRERYNARVMERWTGGAALAVEAYNAPQRVFEGAEAVDIQLL